LSAKLTGFPRPAENFATKFRRALGRPANFGVKSDGQAEARLGNALPDNLVFKSNGRRPIRRLGARVASIAAIAAAGLAIGAAPAFALPEGYHYELVSPPDKNDGDVGAGLFVGNYFASPDGNHLAYNALGGFGDAGQNTVTGSYAASRGTESWSSTSLMLNMLPASILGVFTAPAISNDFSTALTTTNLNQETGDQALGFGGFTYMLDVATRDADLFSVPAPNDPQQNATYNISNEQLVGNDDFSRIVYTAGVDLLDDGLSPTASRVFLYDNGNRSLVSVLPNGDPTVGQLALVHRRPVSADFSVAYFNGTQSPNQGLYRRDIAAGETARVNADERSGGDPLPAAAATFVGASADGEIAYFISNQQLVDEDEDTSNDLYRYDHSQAEGSRLTLISVDEELDDGQAVVQAGHGVSADGETVLFTASNQLVPGEPTGPGNKLYAYTDGELRYVSPSTLSGTQDRFSKLAENGETFVFLSSAAGITPEDNGGLAQVYVYDIVEDEVHCASCRPDGPNEHPASIFESPNLTNNLVTAAASRRVVSTEGHVFFHTLEALLPQDTNNKIDVYVWQDGELDLISTGRSTDHSWFLDASVDGSTVFFSTREQLSNWDWDNRIDAYAARTGEALPEPPEPVEPCTGDDCQGPPPLPKPFEVPSSNVEGPGNPDPAPVNCTPAERKANQLAKKAQRLSKKAKRLAKQARKASGKKSERLKRRATKTKRKAKNARQQAQKARTQLALCREEAQL